MRIRTDGKYAHRKDTIERAADHYGCNKSRALLLAAEDVSALHEAIRDILERPDLTTEQRHEIADTLETRGVSIDIVEEINVELG